MKLIQTATITMKVKFEYGSTNTVQEKIDAKAFKEAAFDPVVGDTFTGMVENIKKANGIA